MEEGILADCYEVVRPGFHDEKRMVFLSAWNFFFKAVGGIPSTAVEKLR